MGEFVLRDPDGGVETLQRILGNHPVAVLAEDQANGSIVGFMPQLVVHDVQVEVHLPRIAWLEGPGFQVDDDEAAELQMVEEQVDVEVFITDFDPELPADEGEAFAEFEKELFQVVQELSFEFPLVKGFLQGEEVEDVGVLEGLNDQVGLRRRQQGRHVRDGLALTGVDLAFDLAE